MGINIDVLFLQAVVPETGKATCLLADELSNVLWVGHADGRVTGHSLGDAPGTAINSQQLCCWQVGAPPCSMTPHMLMWVWKVSRSAGWTTAQA